MKRLVFLSVVLVATSGIAVAGGEYSPKVQKPEWRYIDEPDDAKAAEQLEKLLKKHAGERKAPRLLATLRKGRRYLGGLSKNETDEHPCADGIRRKLTYHLPSRYTPKRKHGVIVFLHGAVRQGPPGGGHHEARTFGAVLDDLKYIKVGPSTYGGHEWGEPAVRAHVRYALDYVKQRFNVDEDRVCIAGDSDGARGTYTIPETDATFYAAAIPVIGAPGGVTRFGNLKNLPWFAINGDKDTIFAIDRVRQSIDAMKKAGLELEWQVVEGGPHNPNLIHKYKKEIQEFVKAHPRDPLPKTVDWQVDPADAGFPANTFRWIRIDETGGTGGGAKFDNLGGLDRPNLSRIRAVKGEGNAVEVETRGVKRFTILVSDEMFDLEQPIVVNLNRKPAFKEKRAVDARVLLEEARRMNDRRLFFANRITIEVK